MKKIIKIALILILFIPIKIKAVNLTTDSLIAQDINSGRVFYKKNESSKRLIASTTKIMTAILAIENSNLTDLIEAKEEILKMYGSNIYLEKNEKMLMIDLIYGLMMRSGNDAAVVIAKNVGGTEEKFVKMMNKKAKEIGMTNTLFSNPTGLDDDTKNYSTAEDLAKLYSYAYKNDIFKKISGTNHYRTKSDLKSYDWYNRNKILSLYDKATGGKTGYTPSAKRILVTSASNDDLDITIASFNSIYDYDLHINLYEDIFNNYKNYLLLDKDNFIYKNNLKNENLYIKNSFYYPLTEEEKENISYNLVITNTKKDETGKVEVLLNNKVIKEEKIYKENKKDKSFIDKIISFIKNLVKKK